MSAPGWPLLPHIASCCFGSGLSTLSVWFWVQSLNASVHHAGDLSHCQRLRGLWWHSRVALCCLGPCSRPLLTGLQTLSALQLHGNLKKLSGLLHLRCRTLDFVQQFGLPSQLLTLQIASLSIQQLQSVFELQHLRGLRVHELCVKAGSRPLRAPDQLQKLQIDIVHSENPGACMLTLSPGTVANLPDSCPMLARAA